MSLDHLFSPLSIGNITLANRVMQLATTNNLDDRGKIGVNQIAFYEERAKDGVGAIVTEGLAAHGSTQGGTSQGRGRIGAYSPEVLAGLTDLATAIHSHNVPIIGQVYHGGRQHHSDIVPLIWGPSPIPCPHSGGVPHEMTTTEIEGFVQSFADAAGSLQRAGFDGTEIHGAQGHLIQEFFSPFSNQRTDEYGGSLENRMRFGLDVLRRVRERVGKNFVVGFRLGAEEYSDHGIDEEMACQLAERVANAGLVDYISVTVGNFKSIEIHVPDRHHARMEFSHYAASVRKVVEGLPVVTCGRIIEPEAAEQLLAAEQADIIGLCRPLLSDAQWTSKAREGRSTEIRKCISCNQCWGTIIDNRGINCIQNAATGRELAWGVGTMDHVDTPKKVWVIGGGPAGMEAARVAAERGHDVSLYESKPDLGGSVNYAAAVPGHEETGYVVDYLRGAVARAGVDVHLGTTVTAEDVLAQAPDAVVVAAGSIPRHDALGGSAVADTGSIPVYTSHDVAGKQVDLTGKRVVLFEEDGYYQSCEIAEMVGKQGADITMVSRFWEVGREIPATSRVTTIRALDLLGIRIIPTTWFDSVDGSTVVLRHELSERTSTIADVDAIIHVGFNRAQDQLGKALDGKVAQLNVIGDAYMPRRIADAVFEGHRTGRDL